MLQKMAARDFNTHPVSSHGRDEERDINWVNAHPVSSHGTDAERDINWVNDHPVSSHGTDAERDINWVNDHPVSLHGTYAERDINWVNAHPVSLHGTDVERDLNWVSAHSVSLHGTDAERYINWVNAHPVSLHGTDVERDINWVIAHSGSSHGTDAERDINWVNAHPVSSHGRDVERDINWVNVSAFVPRRKTQVFDFCPPPSAATKSQGTQKLEELSDPEKEVCPVCKITSVIFWSEEEKYDHIQECDAKRSMEKCKEMECVVCMENILDTQNPSRVPEKHSFGILENCNHVLCLPCIRTWRSNTSVYNYRSCPYCRTPSDFVAPAVHWVEENCKKELINKHKENVRKVRTLWEALEYVFGDRFDFSADGELIVDHPFVPYDKIIPVPREIVHLAAVKQEHWLCLEDEMDKTLVDRDRLLTPLPFINHLINIKKIQQGDAFQRSPYCGIMMSCHFPHYAYAYKCLKPLSSISKKGVSPKSKSLTLSRPGMSQSKMYVLTKSGHTDFRNGTMISSTYIAIPRGVQH